MRVLVVDDDPVVLASCRRVLESAGFSVITAASVADAVAATAEQGFGLILVDIKMPERDGISLMAKVATWRKPVPLVAMSGYPTQETVQSSLAAGAVAFLPKPFTPEELLAAVGLAVPAQGPES